MAVTDTLTEISSEAELRELLGTPAPPVIAKSIQPREETPEELERIRSANESIIGQFKHCRQCRADAVGLIGKDVNVAEAGCAIP